jgi:hypothetical protein
VSNVIVVLMNDARRWMSNHNAVVVLVAEKTSGKLQQHLPVLTNTVTSVYHGYVVAVFFSQI